MAFNVCQKPCPLCGARNSLEIDYNLGEVTCLSCIKVVCQGLIEDDQVRYDEGGGNQARGDREENVSAGIVSRAGGMPNFSSFGLPPVLLKLLSSLTEKSMSSDTVKGSAKALFNQFQYLKKQRSGTVEKKEIVLLVCFHIESVIHQRPITETELGIYESRALDRLEMSSKKAEILAFCPEKKAEYDAARVKILPNLVHLFLLRLQWKLFDSQGPVTQVATILKKLVTLDQYDALRLATLREEEAVVVGIVLTHSSKGRIKNFYKIRPRDGAPSVDPNDDQLIAEVASCVRMELKHVKKLRDVILGSPIVEDIESRLVAGEQREKADAASTAAVGAKRPREE